MSKSMQNVFLSNGPLINEKLDEITTVLNKETLSLAAWEKLNSHSHLATFKKQPTFIMWNWIIKCFSPES